MQKLIGSVLCCILLISANTALAYEREIKVLSATIVEKIAKAGKKNVAVTDFTDLQGNTTELGRFLAEELSSDLSEDGKGFEIVDRNNLKSILAEHKFSMSGLVDPNTVKELGRIAGVDAIVTGTVTPFGDSVRVSVRVIATDTAKVIATAKGDIAKTKAIEELLARGIETGQANSSPTTGSSYVSSAGSQKSKKVGNVLITIKRLEVLKGSINLTLDIFNQSDMDLWIAMGWNGSPTLTDEKGNVYVANRSGSVLNSKSSNDLVVTFTYRDDIKNVGFNFSFFSKVKIGNNDYEVSFMDVKAQKPK